jgi:predicted  nucleic acid-binding Zn-ribbon protein
VIEQLKLLIELQEMDSSILLINEKKESLPHKLEYSKAALKETSNAFQKVSKKYDDLNKIKKNKDLGLEEIQDKINKLRSRGSEIKTNKEYEAHLKEIEGFEKNKYKIEDEILSAMEDIENFSREMKEEEIKLKKADNDFKQHEKELEEESKKLDSEIEMCMAKRKEFVERIDDEIYSQYMNLLKRLGDMAVVPTKNEVCLGCNTNIPPQLYNDIKKNDDLYTCYYCKRFLYFKEAVPSDINSREAPPAPK